MKSLILIFLIFGIQNPVLAKNKTSKVSAEQALKTMSRQRSLNSVIRLLQTHMSEDDGKYLMETFKKTGRNLSKPYRMKINKSQIVVDGLGPIQVRLDGKEITYKNKVIRKNNRLSFKENVKNAAKLLASANKKRNRSAHWWIQEAHASDYDLDQPLSDAQMALFEADQRHAESQAMEVVTMLTYISEQQQSPTMAAQAKLLSSQEFLDGVEKRGTFAIEKILTTCSKEPKGIIIFMMNGNTMGFHSDSKTGEVTFTNNPEYSQPDSLIFTPVKKESQKDVAAVVKTMCDDENRPADGTYYDTYWKARTKIIEQGGSVQ